MAIKDFVQFADFFSMALSTTITQSDYSERIIALQRNNNMPDLNKPQNDH